jgi:UDP-3-O-[3-hydroxymyristoyl] glucosamine N-acyltransferase
MYTVRQIADALGAECEGDESLVISKTAEPQDAGARDLALATAPKYAESIARALPRWPCCGTARIGGRWA